METEVLICGAGACGLTLAIELARRNVAFRLIEKQSEPFQGSRGKGIQPRSQEIFEDLGVLDRLVAAGGPYPPERIYKDDGSHVDNPLATGQATAAEPYHLTLMVPQFITERILRDRLAELGHRVEYGVELLGFEQDEGGVTAELSDGSSRARYLIGSDGGRSFVRPALKIGFPGETLGVRAVVADVRMTGISNAWHRFNQSHLEEMIMLCPLAGTDLIQIQGPVPSEGDVDVSAGGLTALLQKRTGRPLVVDEVAWASVYSMNARLAERYKVGRVILAGDAAHIHPPTGGQGLNTSVQDAYNLGWKLAAVLGGAPEELLDTYEEERRPVAAGVLGLSIRLLDQMSKGPLRRSRETQQLDLGYPDSSLAGPRGGNRAPDAPLQGAGGQPIRLFQLLAGTHWTLVGYETDERCEARAGLRIYRIGGDLLDSQGYFCEAYGVKSGEWVLVRPDGYIATVGELPEIES
ncbi:unnamed protein product, partial [Phaeothamnion confervicola]